MKDWQILIDGVVATKLSPHPDSRGYVTELYREEWDTQVKPLQWNLMASKSNVLRGTHVHVTHSDYLTVCTGSVIIGLKDIRAGSQTYGKAQSLVMRNDDAMALTIPTGVVHGFFFPEPTNLLYGVSEYWNPADELGCMWNEPELGLSWPTQTPILSQRDQSAGSFQAMIEAFENARAAAS